jgi:hypothetical protein
LETTVTSRIVNIQHYTFCKADRLLLDANVWLLVYGPLLTKRKRKRAAIYSVALRRMLAAKSQLHLDVLILSEFINRFARLEHHQRPRSAPTIDFKEFRNSREFEPIAKDIAANAKRIANVATRCESRFKEVDIDTLLDDYGSGGSDFNDQMLTELCKAEALTFVTHDADFKNAGIPIVTANPNLLP